MTGCGGSNNSVGNTPPSQPSPTFTSVTPSSGLAGGGTPLTITGTNFRSGLSVTIGGAAVTSLSLSGPTSIAVTTPAHAVGTANIVITNSDATSVTATSAFTFTANPTPTITNATPSTITVGSASTSITITGTGYTAQSTVQLNAIALSSQFVSNQQLTASLPANLLTSAQFGRLVVSNPAPGGGSSDSGAAFASGPALPFTQYGGTATVLSDGRILVCGGANGSNVTNSAAIYDPSTNQFTAVGSMSVSRYRHTATLLNSGKVLIAGGFSTVGSTTDLFSAELFDPAAGTFSVVGSMQAARARHAATLLTSGKVLLTGGDLNLAQNPHNIWSELFDPSTNTFSAGPQMAYYRVGHSAVGLNDGTVLVLGGVDGSTNIYLAAAELYNPSINAFTSVGSMQYARSRTAAVLMSDSRVFVAGGINSIGVVDSAEIYSPTAKTFSTAGQMNWAVFTENATLLHDGTILVSGGQDSSYSYSVAEVYKPTTGTFSAIPGMTTARFFAQTAILPSGNVFVVGGTGDGTSGLNSTETFSATNLSSEYLLTIQNPAPSIVQITPSPTIADTTNTITGSGFNSSTEMFLNGNSVASSVLSPTQLNFTMPVNYGTYSLQIMNPAPGGGITTAVQQTGHVELWVTPTSPQWLPSSIHNTYAIGGGTINHQVREGPSCGNFSTAVSGTGSPSILSDVGDYVTPATPETCHIDFTSSVDPSAITTATVTISPSPIHATSVTLQSQRGLGTAATALNDGSILITGGPYSGGVAANSAELYYPNSNTGKLLSLMTDERSYHTATLLSSGRVLLTGGLKFVTTAPNTYTTVYNTSAEVYDPVTSTFTAVGSMSTSRFGQVAFSLSSGDVLIAGGCWQSGGPQTSEIFKAATNSFVAGPVLTAQRCNSATAVLKTGQLLIAGGSGTNGCLSSAELL
jgi:hypothetical protein